MLRQWLWSAAVALLLPAFTAAQTPAPAPAAPTTAPVTSPFEGVFSFGALVTDNSDYLGRVGEYKVLEEGTVPALGLRFWGERRNSRFDAFAQHSGNARDQRYRFDGNWNRRLSAMVSYDRMPHRLDHDPLNWMDASSNIGGTFVVGHSDNDPDAQYALTRGELKAHVEYAVPFANTGNIALFASHRREMREGTHQTLTTNHCATCHTESDTRRMDQTTRDVIGGARLKWSALTVHYAFTNRQFKEDTATPTNVYNTALHPATLADVFVNRVSYDSRSGELPYDTVPGLRKNSHDVRARLSLPRDASVTGSFTQSTSRNLDTGLDLDYVGGGGRFVMPIGKKVVFRAGLKRYDLSGDSVFVDVAEPVAPAGPAAGLTYAEAYPQLGIVDYERVGLSRTPTNVEVDLIYRPWKKTTVRAGYEWEAMERGDAASVDRTTTNTVRGSIRSTVRKTIQFQARMSYDWITDPFARAHAAMPLVLQPYASPGNLPFTGLQYFEFYRTREASLTMYPARAGFFEEALSWTPNERVSLSGHYRYRRAINDDLTVSQWEQSTHLPGAQIWVSPGGPVTLSAGYTYQRERTETGFATLAFVG